MKGNEFLALVDRLSGMMSCHNTNFKGAKEFLKILRVHCQKNGIPREVCSDGASVFMCHETQEFFKRYNIHHRVSSVANPHSNSRSEIFVKNLKRLLQEYVSGTGCLDNDTVTQALLAHANTPCKVFGKSPAQLAYGRKFKDFFPRSDYVQMQNLRGNHPLKSDRAGMVVSKNGFSNYSVKVFGSATVTKRNRATLRKVDPRSIPGYQYENVSLPRRFQD